MKAEIFNALFWIIRFLGIAAVGYILTLRLLKPKKHTHFLLLLPLSAQDGDARDLLYAQHMRLQLLGVRDRCSVVALDPGLPEAQKRTCECFCRSIENTYCCTAEELPQLVHRLQKEQNTHGVSEQ